MSIAVALCKRQPVFGLIGLLSVYLLPFQADAASTVECRIDQQQSGAVIRVYKEGKLSAFGDNHLISTSHLPGRFLLDQDQLARSMLTLSVPTQSLIVNDPALRARAESGFNTRVSAFNRKITRKSMLGKKVLYAKRYPEIRIQSRSLPANFSGFAEMDITLKGITNTERVAIRKSQQQDRYVISGQFDLKQSDYEITPFSIMFGGIRVKDVLRLNFELIADC